METTGREQIKTETEGEIRGTKDGADFLDEPKNLLEREREWCCGGALTQLGNS